MAESGRTYSLSDILAWLNPLPGAELANQAELGALESEIRIERPAPLALSKAANIAFFFSREFESELPSAAPGILITAEPFVKPLAAAGLDLWKRSAVVSCADPHLAMALFRKNSPPGSRLSRTANASPNRYMPQPLSALLLKSAKASRWAPTA